MVQGPAPLTRGESVGQLSRVALIVKGWEIEQKKAERPPPPPPPPAKAVKGKGDIIAVPSWSEQEREESTENM